MKSARKWLYRFKLEKTVMAEEEMPPTKNEEGEEIVQKKKIAKQVSIECALKKPTRKLFEEGELYYSVMLSKFIQAGLLTKTLLAKRFQNDGGTISEEDKSHYAKLYSLLATKESEIKKIQIDLEMNANDKTEKLHELFLDMSIIRRDLVDFEGTQSSLFDQTAEHKAKNKTIMWWVMMMSYWKDEGGENFEPLFGEGEYTDREEVYDKMEEECSEPTEENEHILNMIKKFSYFVAFWFSGQAVDKKTFDEAAQLLGDLETMDEEGVGDQLDISSVATALTAREQEAALDELDEEVIAENIKKYTEDAKTPEEPKEEEPKAEEPKAEEPKAEEPKAEEPKAEEPKAEEPKEEEAQDKIDSQNENKVDSP